MIVCPAGRLIYCPTFNLNRERLDTVHKYNYLGVHIDDDLTFSSFLKEKCNRVNTKIY